MTKLKDIEIEYCENDGSFNLLSDSYEVDIDLNWKGDNPDKELEPNSSITWHDNGGKLKVTKDFRWDITDPTGMLKKNEKLALAAMAHDVLYNAIRCGVVKRECVGEVNDLFNEHMKEVDFCWLLRKPVILAVRAAARRGRPRGDCQSGVSRFPGPCDTRAGPRPPGPRP